MWLLPWDVAGVCEREVADPQMVHDAQGCHAAVDGVAPLHADQAGRFVLFEGVHDAYTDDKRMIQPGRPRKGVKGGAGFLSHLRCW